jgi:hypothetical protein
LPQYIKQQRAGLDRQLVPAAIDAKLDEFSFHE